MRVHSTIAALAGLFTLAGCSEPSGASLHFILPDDYRGLVQIIQDPVHGVDVKEQAGYFTFNIPADGELRVVSLRPFESWHKESAAFQSGAALKTPNDGNIPGDAVAFRELPDVLSNGVMTIRYVVGTQKDTSGF